MGSANSESPPVDERTERSPILDGEGSETDFSPGVRLPGIPTIDEDPLRYEDPVMKISGTGHWFLEGWIGDHSVEFLVDSGSSVTAMSDIFYRTLVHASAPLGTLQTQQEHCTAQMERALNSVQSDSVRLNTFGHEDADIAFDPLSANRRFSGTADLAVLGTLVFAGPTRESIDVMVPDCIVPPAGGTVRTDLRHHVSLSLGPALDMSNWVPETQLEKALCPSSLAETLVLQRQDYWTELNPILKKWKSVNNGRCPECARPIKVNMARHLRLVHTKYVLEVPGAELLVMVRIRAERQRPY